MAVSLAVFGNVEQCEQALHLATLAYDRVLNMLADAISNPHGTVAIKESVISVLLCGFYEVSIHLFLFLNFAKKFYFFMCLWDRRSFENAHGHGLSRLLRACDSSHFQSDPSSRRLLASAQHQIVNEKQ